MKVNNAMSHYQCEASLLPQAILNHVVSRVSFSGSVCMELVLYPPKNKEIYDIVLYQNFFLPYIKKRKFKHMGHIRIAYTDMHTHVYSNTLACNVAIINWTKLSNNYVN